MRPVSSKRPLSAPDVAPRWASGAAGAAGLAAGARAAAAGAAAVARAAAASRRDGAETAGVSGGVTLDELLGRVPAHGARGLAALLPPPPGPAPRGVAWLARALRRGARRARGAGGAGDALGRAAAAVPGGAALQAALESEQRLGEVLERLGTLQDQVTAAMTAVSAG